MTEMSVVRQDESTDECDGKKAPDVNYPEVGMRNRTASPATTAPPVCHH